MTSLEFWCFACITFTFGSLVNYVIILFKLQLSSYNPKVMHLKLITFNEIVHYSFMKISDSEKVFKKEKQMFPAVKPDQMKLMKNTTATDERDYKLELILFSIIAIAFLVFNLVYWSFEI